MNTGQMIITTCAMLLLAVLVLRVSSTQITTQESMQTSKFGILAISIANSVIEQACNKAFDQKSINTYLSDVNSLTKDQDLGPEGGEDSIEVFNDFDDFNGYTHVYYNLPDSPPLRISCVVNYVDPDATGNKVKIVTSKQWHKMITITITSDDSTKMDVLEFRKVFSYWKFL